MALRSIDDWDKILKPLKPAKKKAGKSVKKLDRREASKAALEGDHWHDNMLRMVGSWIAKGNNDEEIHVLAAKHTLPEYTAEHTQQEIQKMIDGARNKGFAPARSFEELLDAIETISQDDIEGIETIIEESRSLPSIKLETVQRALNAATGYTLGAIRKQRSELFAADPEPDQLDLAKKAISVIGRDNVLHTTGQTWLWNLAGVWDVCEDRAIKQITQKVIDNDGLDVSAGLVNGVCDVLKSEIEVFGEDAYFRNVQIKILKGTTAQTKNMRVAGFYQNETFDVLMLHPNQYISTETSPEVNETLMIESVNYRIREIEVLEMNHGFKLIVEKVQ